MSSCEGGGEVWREGVWCCAEGGRLVWFVHVVRDLGRKTQLIEMAGHWPPGRPRKTWRKIMQKELARGASSEQRSVVDCHQPSHLVKMRSKDVKGMDH